MQYSQSINNSSQLICKLFRVLIIPSLPPPLSLSVISLMIQLRKLQFIHFWFKASISFLKGRSQSVSDCSLDLTVAEAKMLIVLQTGGLFVNISGDGAERLLSL